MDVKANSLGIYVALSLLSVVNLMATTDLRLVEAAKQGDKDAVRSLLKQHADVNAARPDGSTALAWASYRDDLETADLLIAARANVNAANDDGITPLLLACNNRSVAMVDRLLKAGANPNAASEWTGETPLMRCAATGALEAVKSLLARGADVKAKDLRQGHTALMWTLGQKHSEVARVLIENGADVNAHAKSGFTPLMFAAQQGDMDSARALLESGATVNEATNENGTWEGQTALLVASLNGHEALSIFLLDKGADPNATDENGFTALHFAVLKGLALMSRVYMTGFTSYLTRPNMEELVKALLAHGANPNARVKNELGGDEFYRVQASPFKGGLLTNGTNFGQKAVYEPPPGSVSPVGATAFIMAAISYDANLMRILAAGGADPLLTTNEGVTALMVAAGLARERFTGSLSPADEKNALEAVQVATELGNDVNASDHVTGLTALHGAVFNASNTIVQYLVEKGADVDAKDKAGETPLTKALDITAAIGGAGNLRPGQKWKSTADLLLKSGATPVKISTKEVRPCGAACPDLPSSSK